MDSEHTSPLDPITGLPWSATLRPQAAIWAATGEVHAVCLHVAGLSVLIDAFGYRAAHSVLRQVGRQLARLLNERDLLGRHSGNTLLILTQRPYAEIETLVEQIHERVFTLSIETAEGRVPEGRFGVAGMDPVETSAEAGAAIDALIINAEIALGAPAKDGTRAQPVTKDITPGPAAAEHEAAAPLASVEPEAAFEREAPFEPIASLGSQAVVEREMVEIPALGIEAVTAEPEPVTLNGGGGEDKSGVSLDGAAIEESGPSPRVALVRCDVSDSGLAATVEIEIRFGERVAIGKVVGRNAPDRLPYLVAEATGRALTDLLPKGFGVVLQDLREVTQGDNQALWATVMLVSPEGEEKLLGVAARVSQDNMGPAKAVLNAINRRISLVLAQAS